MAKKRANKEGSVFQRKDGRWVGAAITTTVDGRRKRVAVYGRTRQEASQKLVQILAKDAAGARTSDSLIKLADYLDYWLENFIKPNRRPATWEQHEMLCRLYLKPALGHHKIRSLSVPQVQTYLNELLANGRSIPLVRAIRTTLRAALTRAEREELMMRNVAKLVELPQVERGEIHPWTIDEARAFLLATSDHRLHAAFVLLVFYGMRCGEVLGLRWRDVDFVNHQIHLRQQLQALKHGKGMTVGPLKTKASKRDLPLLPTVTAALLAHCQQQAQLRATLGEPSNSSADDNEFVFTTSTGRPVNPSSFNHQFKRQCSIHGIRIITVHHLRHTAATMMKDQGVPARDTQFILGHSTSWVTEQIYQHDSMASRAANLAKVEAVITQQQDYGVEQLSAGSPTLLSGVLSSASHSEINSPVQTVLGAAKEEAQTLVLASVNHLAQPSGVRIPHPAPKQTHLLTAGEFTLFRDFSPAVSSHSVLHLKTPPETGVDGVLLVATRQSRIGRAAIKLAIKSDVQLPLISPVTSIFLAMNLCWYASQPKG
jgi:integrase